MSTGEKKSRKIQFSLIFFSSSESNKFNGTVNVNGTCNQVSLFFIWHFYVLFSCERVCVCALFINYKSMLNLNAQSFHNSNKLFYLLELPHLFTFYMLPFYFDFIFVLALVHRPFFFLSLLNFIQHIVNFRKRNASWKEGTEVVFRFIFFFRCVSIKHRIWCRLID